MFGSPSKQEQWQLPTARLLRSTKAAVFLDMGQQEQQMGWGQFEEIVCLHPIGSAVIQSSEHRELDNL